jgi:hypothetical protein
MECHLGKYLASNETVDHIDQNFRNNNLDNPRVMDRVAHSRKDALRLLPVDLRCQVCGKSFSLVGKRLHDAIYNRARGKKGPFCSKSCAGIGGRLKLPLVELPRILESNGAFE